MALRGLLVVAFGPALSISQTLVTSTVTGVPSSLNQWGDGFLSDPAAKCANVPSTPQTFFGTRKWWSIFNTIVFTDRKGEEIGFVESWMGDWNNIFGYPGATLYLKGAKPVTKSEEAVWNIGADTTLSHEALARQEQTMFDDQESSQVNADSGFHDFLFRSYSESSHTMAAFIVGNSDGPYGDPFADDMTIRDCKGMVTAKATKGKLIFRNSQDAQYIQVLRNTENQLIVQDLANPPADMVRITSKEPCFPFPPFCAGMGDMNWFNHGKQWMGEIMHPGKTLNMAGITGIAGPESQLTVTTTSGQAEDMRFLFLYSAYQFSNTRWSPAMNLFWILLIVCSITACCRCCYDICKRCFWFMCCCWLPCCCCFEEEIDKGRVENKDEVEVLMSAIDGEKQGRSGWACCSRRQVEPLK